MSNYGIIVIMLLIAILCSGIWQILILYRRSRTQPSINQIDDSKYYELKYRLEMVTTIVPIIIAFISLFGYNQFDKITQSINDKVEEKIKPKFDSVNEKFVTVNKTLNDIQQKAQNVGTGLDTSSRTLVAFENRIKILQGQFNTISSKDVIQQNIYIVSGLKNDYNDWKTYRFKDMVTVSGNKLPDFKRPPFVIAINDYGYDMVTCDITVDHFKGFTNGAVGGPVCTQHIQKDQYEFSVLILEK